MASELIVREDILMAARILIVEDNSRLAESMAVCLNEAGYETSWAKNSAQGIEKALRERPDLIITDLHLPDMVAIEAIKILNNDSTYILHSHCCPYSREWSSMENQSTESRGSGVFAQTYLSRQFT